MGTSVSLKNRHNFRFTTCWTRFPLELLADSTTQKSTLIVPISQYSEPPRMP